MRDITPGSIKNERNRGCALNACMLSPSRTRARGKRLDAFNTITARAHACTHIETNPPQSQSAPTPLHSCHRSSIHVYPHAWHTTLNTSSGASLFPNVSDFRLFPAAPPTMSKLVSMLSHNSHLYSPMCAVAGGGAIEFVSFSYSIAWEMTETWKVSVISGCGRR